MGLYDVKIILSGKLETITYVGDSVEEVRQRARKAHAEYFVGATPHREYRLCPVCDCKPCCCPEE